MAVLRLAVNPIETLLENHLKTKTSLSSGVENS